MQRSEKLAIFRVKGKASLTRPAVLTISAYDEEGKIVVSLETKAESRIMQGYLRITHFSHHRGICKRSFGFYADKRNLQKNSGKTLNIMRKASETLLQDLP